MAECSSDSKNEHNHTNGNKDNDDDFCDQFRYFVSDSDIIIQFMELTEKKIVSFQCVSNREGNKFAIRLFTNFNSIDLRIEYL